MRLAALFALAACSGPISPPIGSHARGSEARATRAPPNAPPDPIGTTRPGDRSCTEDRDCRAGERCYPPDYTPPAPPPPTAAGAPAAPSASPIGAAASPIGAAASPVGPSASPVGPTAVPVGPTAVPVGPTAVPVGPT